MGAVEFHYDLMGPAKHTRGRVFCGCIQVYVAVKIESEESEESEESGERRLPRRLFRVRFSRDSKGVLSCCM